MVSAARLIATTMTPNRSRNPESRRYRFSLGDKLIFLNPLLDRRGGSPAGTLYGDATVVGGRTAAWAMRWPPMA